MQGLQYNRISKIILLIMLLLFLKKLLPETLGLPQLTAMFVDLLHGARPHPLCLHANIEVSFPLQSTLPIQVLFVFSPSEER